MSEFVTEDGEVIEDEEPADPQSPHGIAMRELAAFKFRLIKTVAADPRLRKAPCLAAVAVLSEFVTIDRRTLKPTPAYGSLVTLMARGCMKETKAKQARKLLEDQKYLVPIGSKTKEGCVKYRLANPHEERVAMHVHEATEYLKQREAETRKEERRKKPQQVEQPDVGSQYDPNYLGENLSGLGSEGGATPIKVGSAPSGVERKESLGSEGEGHTLCVAANDDQAETQASKYRAVALEPNEARPFAPIDEDEISFLRDPPPEPIEEEDFVYEPPTSEEDVDEALASILDGVMVLPELYGFYRKRLIAGTLRKSMIDEWRAVA